LVIFTEFFTVHTAMVYVSKPVWHITLLCVQRITPNDGQRNCPKHVEFHSKNKFENLLHLVCFVIRNLSRCTVTWVWNKIIIFPSMPRSSELSFLLRSFHKNPVCTTFFPPTCHIPHPSHSSWFDHPNNICSGVRITKLLVMQSSPVSCYFISFRSKYIPQYYILWHPQLKSFSIIVRDQLSHLYKRKKNTWKLKITFSLYFVSNLIHL
jgi:hypothetical protein